MEAFQIAAVYVGTIVGAGFATGKEIVQFFTQYGSIGFITILITGFLFIWLGTKMMLIAKDIGAASYQQFNEYLFGKKIGLIVNIFMLVILICVAAVMLSGAGAVFSEQLGWSFQIGLILTIILALITVFKGVKGLVSVNIIVVPILIIFSIVISVDAVVHHGFSFMKGENGTNSIWRSLFAPILYGSLNIALAQPVLVPLAREINDDWVIKRGGFIGGLLLCFILLTCHISLSSLPNFTQYEIPMAEVVKVSLVSMYGFYVIVIYGEIFTSVVSNLFGIQKQLETVLSIPKHLITFAIVSIIYIISQIGYATLIEHLYPFFGYLSLLLLFLLIMKKRRKTLL